MVIRIKKQLVIHLANAHRSHVFAQGQVIEHTRFAQLHQGVVQSEKSAADAGHSRATIRLQNIAIDGYSTFAQSPAVDNCSQAPTDKPLYFACSARWLSSCPFTRAADKS